jgi:nitroreductase
MKKHPHVPYRPTPPEGGTEELSAAFHETMQGRRSVRFFSDRPVSRQTIETLVRTAGSAPSGANKQPWRFVCVSDPALKRAIRSGAEAEERAFYAERASTQWLEDLEPLGTDADKSYLEVAPWLIVVFRLTRTDEGGPVYYPNESVGIAVGFLLAAIQQAGLAALTHTPSPMRFLRSLLGRPAHERPYLLIPVGHPAPDCTVPDIRRKEIEEIAVFDPELDPAEQAKPPRQR